MLSPFVFDCVCVTSDVIQHSRIDRDQMQFQSLLASSNWQEATKIYSEGGHSIKGSGAARTLQGFSTDAGTKMAAWPLFNTYRTYWNSATYADDMISAALAGTGVFAGQDNIVRAECAQKGSAYQSTWMYVVHEMEDALVDCKAADLNRNEDGVYAWDEAWAFYAGSLEDSDGSGAGYQVSTLCSG
jgi:hypothetical protein